MSQKNLKSNMKNYIYELFIISQYKTENEFRKSHQKLSQKENLKISVKTIFLNYLKFCNLKQKMNKYSFYISLYFLFLNSFKF